MLTGFHLMFLKLIFFFFFFELKVKKQKKVKLPLSGQKIIPTTHTRYLGIIVDKHFSWNPHLKMLKKNLSRANGHLTMNILVKLPKNTIFWNFRITP